MITSKSTEKAYWYNKQTGESTWDPPPGIIYATNGESEEDGDGLPASLDMARTQGGTEKRKVGEDVVIKAIK